MRKQGKVIVSKLSSLLFISFFALSILFVTSCDERTAAGGDVVTGNCPDNIGDVPVHDNSYFYIYSDEASIHLDITADYEMGATFNGRYGNSLNMGTVTLSDCQSIDGNEIIELINTDGEGWGIGAGGWGGLNLNATDSANLVLFVKAKVSSFKGALKIKIEDNDSAHVVDAPFVVDNTWKKIEIPLKSFSDNGIDIGNIKTITYLMTKKNDILYLDCVYFDGAVTSAPKLIVDANKVFSNDQNISLKLMDKGAADSNVTISARNNLGASLHIDVALNNIGRADVTIPFGTLADQLDLAGASEITITYLDSTASTLIKTFTVYESNDEEDIPDYENNNFYIYTDADGIDLDLAPHYAHGAQYSPDFNGSLLMKVSTSSIDGTEAIQLTNTNGANWGIGVGGWSGTKLDLSAATGIVFYAKADRKEFAGGLKVKLETSGGNKEIPVDFTPNGLWQKVSVELSVHAGDIDLTSVTSPFIYIMTGIGDVVYLDCIHIEGPVSSPGSVSLNKQIYVAHKDTRATISLVDIGNIGNDLTLSATDGTDTITIGNVTIDDSGNGEAILNFGPTDDATDTLGVTEGETVSVSFTDAMGVSRTCEASIVPEGVVPRVYVYATTALTPSDILLEEGTDFNNGNWGSGSPANYNYTDDGDYNPVIQVGNGTGWGVAASCLPFINFSAGFASGYTNLKFKFKSNEYDEIRVKFPRSTGTNGEEIEYTMSANASAIVGATGWYDVTVPMSDFGDLSNTVEFAILHVGEAGSFLITDIYFE